MGDAELEPGPGPGLVEALGAGELEAVLAQLDAPRDVCAAAATCSALRLAAASNRVWRAVLERNGVRVSLDGGDREGDSDPPRLLLVRAGSLLFAAPRSLLAPQLRRADGDRAATPHPLLPPHAVSLPLLPTSTAPPPAAAPPAAALATVDHRRLAALLLPLLQAAPPLCPHCADAAVYSGAAFSEDSIPTGWAARLVLEGSCCGTASDACGGEGSAAAAAWPLPRHATASTLPRAPVRRGAGVLLHPESGRGGEDEWWEQRGACAPGWAPLRLRAAELGREPASGVERAVSVAADVSHAVVLTHPTRLRPAAPLPAAGISLCFCDQVGRRGLLALTRLGRFLDSHEQYARAHVFGACGGGGGAAAALRDEWLGMAAPQLPAARGSGRALERCPHRGCGGEGRVLDASWLMVRSELTETDSCSFVSGDEAADAARAAAAASELLAARGGGVYRPYDGELFTCASRHLWGWRFRAGRYGVMLG